MTYQVKLLETAQTYEFDTEYIDSTLFGLVTDTVNTMQFAEDCFNMLDVGGGNGKYVDRFLSSFPAATCTVAEPETYLIDKNVSNDRKILVNETFQSLPTNSSYQVIQFNWVLHHFISDSYSKSCAVQLEGLQKAFDLLEPGGVVLIFENFYEGYIYPESSSRLIYELTASPLLKRITSRLGANTAGVGVCFHSEAYWKKQLSMAGFTEIDAQDCYDFGDLSATKRALLLIDKQKVGFIAAKKPM